MVEVAELRKLAEDTIHLGNPEAWRAIQGRIAEIASTWSDNRASLAKDTWEFRKQLRRDARTTPTPGARA